MNWIPSNNIAKSKPLFPSYIFVFTTGDELKLIFNIKDVINPLFWLNKPVCFAESEIEELNAFIKNHLIIEVKKIDLRLNNVQNETFELKNPDHSKYISVPLNILAIPKLGVLLKSNRILASEFRFKKNQSFNIFLYRLGLSNLL